MIDKKELTNQLMANVKKSMPQIEMPKAGNVEFDLSDNQKALLQTILLLEENLQLKVELEKLKLNDMKVRLYKDILTLNKIDEEKFKIKVDPETKKVAVIPK